MKTSRLFPLVLLLAVSNLSWTTSEKDWVVEKRKGYNLLYTSSDKKNKEEYVALVENGLLSVRAFFNVPYGKPFDIYVHPNRHSLDSAWQKDWGMPDFKSECWMVASGVAVKLDMISPKLWDKESCEHKYGDATKTQQLITHELFHVFHGQRNISPDFSNVEGIDWFVEGLATYASGQCDSSRISQVKVAIAEGKAANELDKFWTGQLRYGLSGSVVMFIDKKYGRANLLELLTFNKKTEVLSALKTTESALLSEWKKYIQELR